MTEFTKEQLLKIFTALDLPIDTANDDGLIIINAPHRTDETLTFEVNIHTGKFRDTVTQESGDIYTLIRLCLNADSAEVENWVKELLGSRLPVVQVASTPSLIVNIPTLDDDFWTADRLKLLHDAQKRLKSNPNHELVQMIRDVDLVTYETLQTFGCGLCDSEVDGAIRKVILIPYVTGAQLYTRINSECVMGALEGSTPFNSFFGSQFVDGSRNMIMAKSPCEAMVFYQIVNGKYDVIGLCDEEQESLSERQQQFLSGCSGARNVFISLDRSTPDFERLSITLAREVADYLTCESIVRLLRYDLAAGPHVKNITELLKAGKIDVMKQLLNDKPNELSSVIVNTFTKNSRFWYLNNKGELKIDEYKLIKVLQNHGFSKYYSTDSAGAIPMQVKITGQILFKPSPNMLCDYIRDEIIRKFSPIIYQLFASRFVKRDKLEAVFLKDYLYKILDQRFLQKFLKSSIDVIRDDADTVNLFYKNAVVQVTRGKVTVTDYDSLTKYAWDNQRIDRIYGGSDSNGDDAVFAKFVSRIMGEDPDRILSLQTHIGYLLHTYKGRGKGRAVVFADENIGSVGQANGGTGKGIVTQALSKISSTRYISGKLIKTSNRFMFMEVEHGDAIICIDDVRAKFDFSSLFTAVTDDLSVERKNQNRFVIPYEESPKVLLTTNTELTGMGSSYERRISLIKFAPRYNAKFTPMDDFGHIFFEDWDGTEWNLFDAYIVKCIHLYLEHGLYVKPVDHKRASLVCKTAQEFVEWAENYLACGVDYEIRKLFRGGVKGAKQLVDQPTNTDGIPFPSFLQHTSTVLGDRQSSTFKKWLSSYADYKGWLSVEVKRHGYDIIQFIPPEK